MAFLAVKNFSRFQHYRDRNPPWIKLYGDVLVDAAFIQLPEAAQAQLVKLWILASQLGHPLPNNPKLLAGKIGTTGKFHLQTLIASGFLIECNDASGVLAECEQSATPSVRARIQSSEDVDDEQASELGEPALTALYVAIWSNSAVTEKWGEQTYPYTQGGSVELADALVKLGVDWQVARDSIYRQCRDSKQSRPPRAPNYFRRGIEEDWERENARRALAQSGERPPAQRAAAPAREHWSDKKAREEREASEKALVQVRWGNVEQRKLKPDGAKWYSRMEHEAKAAGQHVVLYAFERMHEPAEAPRATA